MKKTKVSCTKLQCACDRSDSWPFWLSERKIHSGRTHVLNLLLIFIFDYRPWKKTHISSSLYKARRKTSSFFIPYFQLSLKMACINGGFLSLSSIKSTSPHLKTTPNPSDFFLRFKKPFKPAKISIICAGSSGIKAKAATMDDSPVSFGEEPSVVVKVDGERSYPVFIGSGLLDEHQLIQKLVY